MFKRDSCGVCIYCVKAGNSVANQVITERRYWKKFNVQVQSGVFSVHGNFQHLCYLSKVYM